MISQTQKNFLGLFLIFGLILICFKLNKNYPIPHLELSRQDTALNLNKKFLKTVNLGQQRMITALLWIQTLLESDLEHYQKRDQNSWMFLRFDSITDLSPKFLWAYQFGGLYLSVVKDDIAGASQLILKGLEQFPDDYQLNFHGGSHFYHEEGDIEIALKLFKKIMTHPRAPTYLPSLVGRLEASGGDLVASFQIMFDTYQRSPDGHIKDRLHQGLYAVKAELDLNCLNQNKLNCSGQDFESKPYLYKNEKWVAQKKWKPFRPHKKDKKKAP